MTGKFLPNIKPKQIPEPLWFRLYIFWRLLFTGGSYVDKNGEHWSFYEG